MCTTIDGAKYAEKHRSFFTQVLNYVYNKTKKKRPSLPQLLNIMQDLHKETKVSTSFLFKLFNLFFINISSNYTFLIF